MGLTTVSGQCVNNLSRTDSQRLQNLTQQSLWEPSGLSKAKAQEAAFSYHLKTKVMLLID